MSATCWNWRQRLRSGWNRGGWWCCILCFGGRRWRGRGERYRQCCVRWGEEFAVDIDFEALRHEGWALNGQKCPIVAIGNLKFKRKDRQAALGDRKSVV